MQKKEEKKVSTKPSNCEDIHLMRSGMLCGRQAPIFRAWQKELSWFKMETY